MIYFKWDRQVSELPVGTKLKGREKWLVQESRKLVSLWRSLLLTQNLYLWQLLADRHLVLDYSLALWSADASVRTDFNIQHWAVVQSRVEQDSSLDSDHSPQGIILHKFWNLQHCWFQGSAEQKGFMHPISQGHLPLEYWTWHSLVQFKPSC